MSASDDSAAAQPAVDPSVTKTPPRGPVDTAADSASLAAAANASPGGGVDGTPGAKALNANAKSFVPRGDATPKAPVAGAGSGSGTAKQAQHPPSGSGGTSNNTSPAKGGKGAPPSAAGAAPPSGPAQGFPPSGLPFPPGFGPHGAGLPPGVLPGMGFPPGLGPRGMGGMGGMGMPPGMLGMGGMMGMMGMGGAGFGPTAAAAMLLTMQAQAALAAQASVAAHAAAASGGFFPPQQQSSSLAAAQTAAAVAAMTRTASVPPLTGAALAAPSSTTKSHGGGASATAGGGASASSSSGATASSPAAATGGAAAAASTPGHRYHHQNSVAASNAIAAAMAGAMAAAAGLQVAVPPTPTQGPPPTPGASGATGGSGGGDGGHGSVLSTPHAAHAQAQAQAQLRRGAPAPPPLRHPGDASAAGPTTPLSGLTRPPGALPDAVAAALLAPASPIVHVGNATLVAQRSAQPPKFACILLVGVPGVGKTTLGRQLAVELAADRLGWGFFSGSDHLKDAASRPAPWETTKSVLDALCECLDAQLAKQGGPGAIKGLIIDKQCRGVEDLFYLTAILRQRGLLLWGVVGLEVPDDEVLGARLGGAPGDPGIKEKIKFHRVVQSRIVEAARAAGLWRAVDASGSKADVTKALRTMALGCSSQSPAKQLSHAAYHETACPTVDDYATYCRVMSVLFSCAKPTGKGPQFPGFVNYAPLPISVLEDRKKAHPLRDYAVRRRVDGVKYVLLFDGARLFLVPRHMRCVFELPTDAWLGVQLNSTGRFLLDGDLVKMTKERNKEKFVVNDVLFWSEKGSLVNQVARASWRERQERLKIHLCSEVTAFFPRNGETVVVHQCFEEALSTGVPALLEPVDYPTDGLVFQPTARSLDTTYVWRPPEHLTCDFRLGPAVPTVDGGRSHALEVFDAKALRYVPFRGDTVELHGARPHVMDGAIVTCGLDLSAAAAGAAATGGDAPLGAAPPSSRWVFHHVRFDVPMASAKAAAEELLTECVVPQRALLAALCPGVVVAGNAGAGSSASGANGGANGTVAAGPAATYGGVGRQMAPGGAFAGASGGPVVPAGVGHNGRPVADARGTFGSSMTGPAPVAPSAVQPRPVGAAGALSNAATTVQALEALLLSGSVNVVRHGGPVPVSTAPMSYNDGNNGNNGGRPPRGGTGGSDDDNDDSAGRRSKRGVRSGRQRHGHKDPQA